MQLEILGQLKKKFKDTEIHTVNFPVYSTMLPHAPTATSVYLFINYLCFI
jgi:hypothetical protein